MNSAAHDAKAAMAVTDAPSLSNEHFHEVAEIAMQEAGLAIPDSKKALVQSRLSRRMRQLGVPSYIDYVAIIADPTNRTERRELVSVLTTNVSSFFRERHHFNFLVEDLLPKFRKQLSA